MFILPLILFQIFSLINDLICGSNNSFIATLVERHTRYVMLAKVPGKEIETVINALIRQSILTAADGSCWAVLGASV